jgi:hypothetical protein
VLGGCEVELGGVLVLGLEVELGGVLVLGLVCVVVVLV